MDASAWHYYSSSRQWKYTPHTPSPSSNPRHDSSCDVFHQEIGLTKTWLWRRNASSPWLANLHDSYIFLEWERSMQSEDNSRSGRQRVGGEGSRLQETIQFCYMVWWHVYSKLFPSPPRDPYFRVDVSFIYSQVQKRYQDSTNARRVREVGRSKRHDAFLAPPSQTSMTSSKIFEKRTSEKSTIWIGKPQMVFILVPSPRPGTSAGHQVQGKSSQTA